MKKIKTELRHWESANIEIVEMKYSKSDQICIQGANAFVFSQCKKGYIHLSDDVYSMDKYTLLHVKQGSSLKVIPVSDWIESYVLIYKSDSTHIDNRVTKPYNPIQVKEMFSKMYGIWLQNSLTKKLSLKAMLYEFLAHYYNDLANVEVIKPDPFIHAKLYIDEHHKKPISIGDLTEVIGSSSSNINRIFKLHTGLSPQQYLMKQRMNSAKKYLKDSHLSVNEIATSCGFFDSAYFCKTFKKHINMTPSEFREKYTINMINSPIDNDFHFDYDDEVARFMIKIIKGEQIMFKRSMYKKVMTLGLCFALFLCGCSSEADLTDNTSEVTSDRVINISNFHRMTTYTKVPNRIVSLSYSETEILVALGLEDKIVGIATAESSIEDCLPEYQDEIEKLNKITDGTNASGVPSLEVLLSLEPDFVYGTSYSFNSQTGVGDPEDFDRNNINFYAGRVTYINGGTVTDVYEDILNIGRIFDVEDKAKTLVDSMETKVEKVSEKLVDIEVPKRVFIYDSGEETVYTAGMSLETDMVRLAGGKNVFGDIPKQFTAVGWENIVEADPEVIIVHKWDSTDDPQKKIDFLKNQPELADVTAIKNDNFIVLKFNLAFPCAQNADAVEYLARSMYPEKFE